MVARATPIGARRSPAVHGARPESFAAALGVNSCGSPDRVRVSSRRGPPLRRPSSFAIDLPVRRARRSSALGWAGSDDLAARGRHDAARAFEARDGTYEGLVECVAGGKFAAADDHLIATGGDNERAPAWEVHVDSGNAPGSKKHSSSPGVSTNAAADAGVGATATAKAATDPATTASRRVRLRRWWGMMPSYRGPALRPPGYWASRNKARLSPSPRRGERASEGGG